MSALTKLFVVALVICSLLLTASVVVFVNKVEDHRTARVAAENKLSLMTAEKNVAQANFESLKQEKDKAEKDFRADLVLARNEIANRDRALLDAATARAKVEADKAQTDANLAIAQRTIQQNQAFQEQQVKQIADLKTTNDQLLKRSGDLETALTDSVKKHDAAVRALRDLQEQYQDTVSKLTRFELASDGMGGAAPARGPRIVPAVKLNGVVKGVTPAFGGLYATITLGSADRVEKGMKFTVHNQGRFLATITVETVEPNESFGKLEGPAVTDVKPQMPVTTDLSL